MPEVPHTNTEHNHELVCEQNECKDRPVASNVRLVRPRSCGTMLIIYAKVNHSESAGF